MDKEKHKRTLGEEAKNGFISCFTSLLILISIPVGVLLVCFALFMMNLEASEEEAMAELKPIIRETCNLPDYETDRIHYDSFDLMIYNDYVESEDIYIYCYPTNDDWQCSCSD